MALCDDCKERRDCGDAYSPDVIEFGDCSGFELSEEARSLRRTRLRCAARLERARDEAAVRNAREFGTDPSWYGRSR